MKKPSFRLLLQVLGLVVCCAILLFFLETESSSPKIVQKKPSLEVGHKFQQSVAPERSSQSPLTINEEGRTAPGFTLYPQAGTEKIHLLNMAGESVHSWNLDVARARLLPDCSVLVIHGSKWGLKREPWKSLRHVLRRYDWNGEVIWEYVGDKKFPYHHDFSILENGSIITLRRARFPNRLRSQIANIALRSQEIRSDEMQEITNTGTVTWNWFFHDHLDINSCGKYTCDYSDAIEKDRAFDWCHVNAVRALPENRFFDAGDKRFKPGNLLLTARNWSMVLLVDKDTKEVVWRYSGSYLGGLQYGHEAHMIEKGLPGAGNILVFDNGVERKYSVVLEIDPLTQEPVWILDIGDTLYSPAAGSVQKLSNGNTLIAEDVTGRLLEVTPEKEIVWEYSGAVRTARPHRYEQTYCHRLKGLKMR